MVLEKELLKSNVQVALGIIGFREITLGITIKIQRATIGLLLLKGL